MEEIFQAGGAIAFLRRNFKADQLPECLANFRCRCRQACRAREQKEPGEHSSRASSPTAATDGASLPLWSFIIEKKIHLNNVRPVVSLHLIDKGDIE